MDDGYEYRKKCCARWIYRNDMLDKRLPSAVKYNEQFPKRKQKTDTWSDWWRAMYGDNYNDYIQRLINAKAKSNTERPLSAPKNPSRAGYEQFRVKRRELIRRDTYSVEKPKNTQGVLQI